ncbi:MAG: amidohydrolase family protein [Chloroflexi bacterium]|nr:amidohydrolase family protein [Chloroflexota bacterium]
MKRFESLVIDAHAHIGRLPGHVNFRYTPEELVRCLEAENVALAVTSSASSTTVGQQFGTDEILDAAERYPNRIGALVWINPFDPGWEADAERAAERGVIGIKVHPRLDTYAVDFESLAAVFAFARRRSLPICTHAETGDYSAERYAELVACFDDVPLVLYHVNAGRPIAGILLARRYPNVYLETCGVPREAIDIALDVVGPRKILFGIDAPIYFDIGRVVPGVKGPVRTYHDGTRDIEELVKSPADRDAILSGNAVRLFGLESRVG